MFFVKNALLGIGLAMDAFSVSLANGLNNPKMKKSYMCLIALVFGVFQGLMPLLGWVCVHTVMQYFKALEHMIPWIALGLLAYIGIEMILEGVRKNKDEEEGGKLSARLVVVQGVATSIDALSVGFTIASYSAGNAILAALLIATITFVICLGGIVIGKRFGTKLSEKASVFGGIILLIVGLEIFITGIF